MTVREVTTVGEVHSEDRVAVIQRSHQHRHVRLCSGVRLNVGMFGAKDLLRAIDRGLLDDVCKLTSTVIALTRISFRIVNSLRPQRTKHCVVRGAG